MDVPVLPPNGTHDLLRMAKQQQQAQQMLLGALQNAMREPLIVHQVNTSMCGVGTAENGAKSLLIALPNGERYDVALSEQVAGDIGRGLLKERDAVEDGAA